MDTDQTTEGAVDTGNNEGEAGNEGQAETIAVPKSEYDKLNQTLGSLKRELKDLKKPKEETKETPQTKPDSLIEKTYLRAAGITNAEDVELALATAKKWGVSIDALVDDADFQVKLEKQRTTRDNAVATSNVRGTNGTSNAKQTSEYWVAKGTAPTPADVPDRATRAKIVREMMAREKGSTNSFYNS